MDDVEHISRKGGAVPLSWFPIPEETELPEDLQGLFRKARRRSGSSRTSSGLTASVPSACAPGSPTTGSCTNPPQTSMRRSGR